MSLAWWSVLPMTQNMIDRVWVGEREENPSRPQWKKKTMIDNWLLSGEFLGQCFWWNKPFSKLQRNHIIYGITFPLLSLSRSIIMVNLVGEREQRWDFDYGDLGWAAYLFGYIYCYFLAGRVFFLKRNLCWVAEMRCDNIHDIYIYICIPISVNADAV